MWRIHFKIELLAENLRKKLCSSGNFNAYEAFNSLDLNNDGIVHVGELKRIIESRGFYVSDNEATQLIMKFDNDRDGIIRFNDFRQEIMPK